MLKKLRDVWGQGLVVGETIVRPRRLGKILASAVSAPGRADFYSD